MKITLKKVSGIDDAIIALRFSKKTWTPYFDYDIRKAISLLSDPVTGFLSFNTPVKDFHKETRFSKLEIKDELTKLAKWGAGVGQSSCIDAGHETILRFIDLTFVVEDLSYNGMADLDSHAMRMNNRIVRSSTRVKDSDSIYDPSEMSSWNNGKILTYQKAQSILFKEGSSDRLPSALTFNGETYVNNGMGFVHKDFKKDPDAISGLFPISSPQMCIFKVNFYDMRHIYMRRNSRTNARQELKDGIESAADQIEEAIPGILGKLIRNDFCDDGLLHHVMDIKKHVDVAGVDTTPTKLETKCIGDKCRSARRLSSQSLKSLFSVTRTKDKLNKTFIIKVFGPNRKYSKEYKIIDFYDNGVSLFLYFSQDSTIMQYLNLGDIIKLTSTNDKDCDIFGIVVNIAKLPNKYVVNVIKSQLPTHLKFNKECDTNS